MDKHTHTICNTSRSLLPGDGDSLHLRHVFRHEGLLGFVAPIATQSHHERNELHNSSHGDGVVLGLGGGGGIEGMLSVDILDGALRHKGRAIALGHGIAIDGGPVGKEHIEDHGPALVAVRARSFSLITDLDKVDVIGGCLHNGHVVGLVDGNTDATIDGGRCSIEAFLALNGLHRGNARVALAVEAHPGQRIELALDGAALALES